MNKEDIKTATSDLVHRDRAVTGLALLLDPQRLLDGLRKELDTGQVENIELKYLRYKPGMNCLARYDLRVGGRVLTAYAKAHGRDAHTKIGKSVERRVSDGILGPGRVVLDDHRVIFSTFPNDTKLVSLQSLNDPAFSRRLLGRVFGAGHAWHEASLGGTLNYKPERRFVTKLIRPDGEAALLKFYSKGGYARARAVSRKLTAGSDGFYPRTLGRSKKYHVVAYQWRPGTTLRQLHEDGDLSMPHLEATAGALAVFHASSGSRLSHTGHEGMTLRLRAIGDQLGILLPRLQPAAMSMAQRLSDWARREDAAKTPVHGDFYDKQAVVDNGMVRLIDLDSACLGDPVTDLASYVAHLERLAINHGISAGDVGRHREALVDAYERVTGTVCRRKLDRYIAMNLFTLSHHPFRDWAGDWPAQTRRLLERVQVLYAS